MVYDAHIQVTSIGLVLDQCRYIIYYIIQDLWISMNYSRKCFWMLILKIPKHVQQFSTFRLLIQRYKNPVCVLCSSIFPAVFPSNEFDVSVGLGGTTVTYNQCSCSDLGVLCSYQDKGTIEVHASVCYVFFDYGIWVRERSLSDLHDLPWWWKEHSRAAFTAFTDFWASYISSPCICCTTMEIWMRSKNGGPASLSKNIATVCATFIMVVDKRLKNTEIYWRCTMG